MLRDTTHKTRREKKMGLENWNTLEELQEQITLRSADPSELYKSIEKNIDYNIRYAEDRIGILESIWDEELYVDCVSSERFKGQQVKKKSSASSEKSPMTYHLDKLADYILYSHFDNEEQEEEYIKAEEVLEQKQNLNSTQITEEDKKDIANLKNKLRYKPLTMSRKVKDAIRRESNESLQQFFETDSSSDVYKGEQPRITYTKVDKEINQSTRVFNNSQRYWAHFAPPKSNKVPHYQGELEPYAVSAYKSLKQMNEAIELLEPRIEELEFFDGMEKERLAELRQLGENAPKNNELVSNELKALTKLKRELRADYNVSAELFRKVVTLSSNVISIEEVIPNDAWERLSFRNEEVYLALIMGYEDLKQRYTTKVGTTMWCLLHDFDKMAKEVELSEDENIIVERIMADGKTPLKVIQEEVFLELGKEITIPTISNSINKNIPKKFREKYDQQLEDWIWIYKRKGSYKTCKQCGKVKLSKYFSIQKTYADGLSNSCKECESIRVRNSQTT